MYHLNRLLYWYFASHAPLLGCSLNLGYVPPQPEKGITKSKLGIKTLPPH